MKTANRRKISCLKSRQITEQLSCRSDGGKHQLDVIPAGINSRTDSNTAGRSLISQPALGFCPEGHRRDPHPGSLVGSRFLWCRHFPIGVCESSAMSCVPPNIHPLSRSTFIWGVSQGDTWQVWGFLVPFPCPQQRTEKAESRPPNPFFPAWSPRGAGRRHGETRARLKQGAGVKSRLHRPKRAPSAEPLPPPPLL